MAQLGMLSIYSLRNHYINDQLSLIVARKIPNLKVACSSHVRVILGNSLHFFCIFLLFL